MSLAKATDNALLLRWRRQGDPAAFAQLVERHAAMVHAVSMRVVRNHALAQEVAQDSFLKLTQLDRFDGASIGGWLHRVATNRAVDVAKSESRRQTRETAYVESRETATRSSESAAVLAEIDTALNELPDDLRELIVLHYLEGVTHKEIARRTGVTRPTVTRSIQRAVELLRERLGKRGITATAIAIVTALESTQSTAAPTFVLALRKLALQHAIAAPAKASLFPTHMVIAAVAVIAATLASVFGFRFLHSIDDTNSEPQAPVAVADQATAPVLAASIAPPPASSSVLAVTSVLPPSQNEPASTTILRCIDSDGNPVPSAAVYVVRRDTRAFAAGPDDISKQIFGPFTGDDFGQVAIPALDDYSANGPLSYDAFARVPGKLVGAWSYSPENPKRDNWDVIAFTPSFKIAGTVTVPAGFDVRKVTVRVLRFLVRGGQHAGSFVNASKFEEFTVPPLAVQHPDAHGNFYFSDMPAMGAVYLVATAPGLAETQAWGLEKKDYQNPDIKMVEESQLFGTVRYEQTQLPAIGVTVFAAPQASRDMKWGNTAPFVARTDSLGRFRFTGLQSSDYVLVCPTQGDWVAPVSDGIHVAHAEQHGPVDITYEHGGIVEGFVRDFPDKAPVPNVIISVSNPIRPSYIEVVARVSTDASGYYRVRVPSGLSWLDIGMIPPKYAHPDSGRKSVKIEPGQRESITVDFSLSAAEPRKDPGQATVTGRALNAAGQPLADVPVYVVGVRGVDIGPKLVGRTGAGGTFRVSVLATGTQRIVLGGGGGFGNQNTVIRFGRTGLGTEFTPQKNETYNLGDGVVSEYKKSIGGVIVDENSAPVAKVTVWLFSDVPGFGERAQITDDDGTFAFNYVPDGEFKLSAVPDEATAKPAAEPTSPFSTTEMEVEPGFDYQVVLTRKDATAQEK